MNLIDRMRLQAEDLHNINPASETVKCLSFGADRIAELEAQLAIAQAATAQLRKALQEVSDLIDNSSGVVGLHLNGDIAQWGELLEGGRFEWLPEFYKAISISGDQDTLHEVRAQAIEEAFDEACKAHPKDPFDALTYISKKAAAHRAKKGN